MKYPKRLFLVSAILLLCGLPIAHMLNPDFFSKTLVWKPTVATVIEMETKRVIVHRGRGVISSNLPNIAFDNVGSIVYHAEGKDYKSNYIIRQAQYELKVGQKINMYYNPEDPTQTAELPPKIRLHSRYILVAFGLILLAVGIVFLTRNSVFFTYR